MNECADCLVTAAIATSSVPRVIYALIFIACVCAMVLILSALDAALRAVFKEERERRREDDVL